MWFSRYMQGLVFAWMVLPAVHAEQPATQLPKVLLIGDSISMGYAPIVHGLLDGEAYVTRPLNKQGGYLNCEGTTRGLQLLETWLAADDWDLIHFNFGLHDLKHVHPETGRNSTNPDHPQQANLAQYTRNLRKIVRQLQATRAKMIFATTTPYPDKPGGPLRRADQVAKYNTAAFEIMREHGIRVNDLHDFVLPHMDKWLLPNNVHFRVVGNRALARRVAEAIREALAAPSTQDHYTADNFSKVEKIDIHFHLHSEDTRFVELAQRDRFRLLNIATQSAPPEVMRYKHRTIFLQHKAHPEHVAPVSSFSVEGWDASDWQEKTIRFLDETFEKGAVGVKVWKNIGMSARGQDGQLVMIDDPQFDPIFDHLAKRGVVLMGHLGEPKNCWLPLEQMTVNNDRGYFRRNPQYHMYLHPEMPSYEEQIAARDRMLEKHSDLPFLAAHLASLEWSVEELAKFLDRFPHAVAGTAARMSHLQYQSQRDREKVIHFITQYQDRLLYGSDSGVGQDDSIDSRYLAIRERWLRDWRYLTTDDMISVPELDQPVRGLALRKAVVDKIYSRNARKLFPQSWGGSP